MCFVLTYMMMVWKYIHIRRASDSEMKTVNKGRENASYFYNNKSCTKQMEILG